MQNGIPWWYFHKHGGQYEGTPVRAADPDGSIARLDRRRTASSDRSSIPRRRSRRRASCTSSKGRRFTLGELDGSTSPRAQAISAAFTRAGFKAPVIDDIRSEIWLKLWGNLSFNPISALTHATLVGSAPVSADARAERRR